MLTHFRISLPIIFSCLISIVEANEPVTRFDQMVVSATKIEKKSFDVPASVSTIDKQELNRKQASRLHDLLKDTPSVDLSGGPRRTAEQPNIRGFGQERTVIRIDGARQNLSFGHSGRIFIDPELLRQVDIMRGPQSTLHGSGAIGGVLSFETLEANDLLRENENWGARAKLGFATNQSEQLGTASLYGRYNETIDGIASFVFRDAGNIKPAKGKKIRFSGDEIKTGLLKSNFYLADVHKISGSFQHLEDDHDILSTPNLDRADRIDLRMRDLTPFLGPDANYPVHRDTSQTTGTVGYHYDNEDNPWLNLKAKFYTTSTRFKDRIINDIIPRFKRNDKTRFHTEGVDIFNKTRIIGNEDFGLNLLYGVEHYCDHQSSHRNGIERLQFPKARGSTTGFYFHQEMTFLKKLTLGSGYRHDHFRTQTNEIRHLPKKHGSYGSPQVSATLKPYDWVMLYTVYAEAFRAPQLSELYGGGVHIPGFGPRGRPNLFIPNPELLPERAATKEAGLGFSFDEIFQEKDKFRTKWAYFITHANDFIERQVDFRRFVTTIQNVSSVRIRGVEGEASYESQTLFGGLGFSAMNGFDRSYATRLASVPPTKFSLLLGSRIPMIHCQLGWRGVMNRKQSHIPHFNRQTQQTPTRKTPGYSTHDVFFSWTPEKGVMRGTEIHLGVDNVFNKFYRKHLSNLPDAGRNFKVALSYKL